MSAEAGKVGVLLLNFGEPTELTDAAVETYLERIFLQNAALDDGVAGGAVERARGLAKRRAPGLLEAYRDIGGSPLDVHAAAQAEAVERLLASRTWDVWVCAAFQFTEPSISDAVAEARAAGVETLVGLPVYPLCGRSTTVAALDDVQAALDALGWAPRFVAIGGWHHHPAYRSMRVDHVQRFLEDRGLDVSDPDTLLYFSVHGTPVKYLDEGNRYDRYAEEHCRDVARDLGTARYGVGFQNHANRGIQWTRPDGADAVRDAEEERLVVVPISFMHEQSETLSELDRDLREVAEAAGKSFHRVPVPHGDARFALFLADLVAEAVAADGASAGSLGPCRWCRPVAGTWCTNGERKLPPSPYVA